MSFQPEVIARMKAKYEMGIPVTKIAEDENADYYKVWRVLKKPEFKFEFPNPSVEERIQRLEHLVDQLRRAD
ncbi:hypothetical protein [Aureimonas altamirensis]|uniref:hypothetical protein n=1 Tax=Aureimonas altamirensis TaxID=370622 RepID=UPI00301A98B5